MMTLHVLPPSGNCWKARLLLGFLGKPYQSVVLDPSKGENRTPEFLAMNPLGQVPVLVDDAFVLRDSQAILVYLASKYGGPAWWSDAPEFLGHVAAWLSTAANEIANGPAALRANRRFGKPIDIDAATRVTGTCLAMLDAHLTTRPWLVGDAISIADIAVFPYLALAHEGGVELSGCPHIRAWLGRIEQLPGFVGF